MAILTLLPKILNGGTSHEGKVFDNPGYDNALKESGWTAEEAKQYWSDVSNTDPYAKAGKDISEAVSAQAPKVSVENGQINISAPQAVLDSPLVSQIEQQLQTLKGSDLSSPEVTNAIDALNKEVQQNLNDWMVEETFGWTPEEFSDYQRAIQIVNVANPLNSKETLKAKRPGADFYYNEDGTIMEKTPQEWVDYWREIFNADQRTDMFLQSLSSDDPYERVMALIMSKGAENPTYGYDAGERIGQGWEAFLNQMKRFPYGVFRLVATSSDVKRVEDFEKKLDLKAEDFVNLYMPKTEEEFEKVKEEIKGKTWKELSNPQKAFIIELGVSKEPSSLNSHVRETSVGDQRYRAEDLKNMSAEDDSVSRSAIENILSNNSFERFKQVSDDYNKMQASDKVNLTDTDERLAKNAIWSNAEQNIGNFTGVLGRFLWENAVGKALTGHSMNRISDVIAGSATEGTGILGWLAKHGISPTSAAGAGALKFTAQLIGTIPEDLVQTSVDNIVTYNADENANLLNPEEMSQNFKNNLIFMSIFNAARAGWSAVKRAKFLKQLAKQIKLDTPIDIGAMGEDAYDAARTVDNGGHLEVDGDTVYKVDVDGTREKLANTTPEQAKIIQSVMDNLVSNEEQAFRKISENRDVARVLANGGTIEVQNGVAYAVDIDGNRIKLDLMTVGDAQLLSKAVKNRDAARILASGGSLEVRGGKVYGIGADGSSTELSNITVEEAMAINKAMTQREAARILANGSTVEVRDGKVHVIGTDGSDVGIDGLTVEDAQVLNKVMSDKEALDAIANGGTLSVENGKIYAVSTDGKKIEISDLSVQDARTLSNIITNRAAAAILANGGNVEVRNGQIYAVGSDGNAVMMNGVTVGDAQMLNRAMTNREVARIIAEGGTVEVRNGKVYAVGKDGSIAEIENFTVEDAKKLNDAMSETKKTSGSGSRRIATPEFDDAARAVNEASSVVDDAGKVIDNGTETTVKVEVDTPNGKVTAETPDITFKSYEDAWSPDFKIEPTKAGFKLFKSRALKTIMNAAQTNLFKEFRVKFGDITTDDFDWIFKNADEGKKIADIIGTRNPKNGKIVDQNMIDAVKWFSNHPMVKGPRLASRAGLGLEGDYNKLGYLPHTNYDPDLLPFEEIKPGQLWKRFTGKSVTSDSGEFVGYGGTLESRYRTYISNMLNDIHAKDIAAAQLIDDAALDGKKLSPDEALKMTEGWQKIDEGVAKSKSSKEFEKGFMSDGDNGKAEFEAATKAMNEEAPKSGISKAMNKNFSEMYIGAGRGKVEQPKGVGSATYAVGTQGDTMRKIKVNGVSMYDAGAADMVYAAQNAGEFVTRWMREGADPSKFRSNLVDYLMAHSKRSRKYAEPVADRIIARIAKENPGGITKGGAIKTLSKAFRSEGLNRLRRWITLADYDQFDKGTTEFMDSFLYRHIQMQSISNNQNIIGKIADKLTEARYDALFYGNFKNALLQVSELNRLFTVFKWGDVGTMLKKMATDADFRAKVDMYVNAVVPETTYLDAGLYGKYGNLNDSMKVGETETKFGSIRDAKKTVDDIALAPINAAESLKNRTMVAALVSEADRLGFTGDEALMYIRQRFERVALAQNEMGKIGLSTNPLAKPFLFLQNFQIRELGMNYYNIVDPIDLNTGKAMKSGKAVNAAKYLMKVFGAKLGTTLLLARLGYSASQTMGLDPLGLVGNYDRLDDDEKTWIDQQISGGILTPLFAGGMTSLFADMYFMAREAYEDAHRETIEDEVGANLNKDQNPLDRMDWEAIFNLNNLGNQIGNFIPGNVFANRVNQMNEMMDTGWALSANGNKMYTAPDDAINTALGYLFGRSATQNAQQYRQTYGEDVGQTLGRIFRGATGQGTTFDPIDTQNYSDWFDGGANDLQQFEKGKRWFIDERDRILDEYQDALQNGYKYGDVYESEAKASMTKRLDDLFEKLGRFVDAYEKENGPISGKMVKELIGVLNVERESVNANQSAADESGLEEYSKAKERYAQLGLPNVGYYSGPSKDYPGTSTDESKTEVKYKGSPQWQVSSTARYDLQSEAAAVLKAGDAMLKDFRNDLKNLYSEAYKANDYTEFNKAQGEYMKAFDKVVGPIVALYGNGILNSKEVKDQLESMLATSSNTGKVNLIPSEQYAKDKYGRYRSMPNESVDVGKWAQQRYSSDTFKNPTVRSFSTAQEDIDAIKRLDASGEKERAIARALELKVRIDNQKRSLNRADYQWLLDYLNNGGK